MADLNTLNELNRQAELLKNNLDNVAKILSDRMISSLSKNVTEADNLVESFEKGENIIKKLSSKLDVLQKESNKNSTIQLKLEKLIADAQRRGNVLTESKLRTNLLQLKAQQKQIEAQQTFFNKLLAASKEQQKQNDILGGVRDKVKEIAKNFTLPGLLKISVDAALNFSKVSTDIGKNLGSGADAADEISTDFIRIAQRAFNTNVTTRNLAEAFGQIVSATGYISNYSEDTLETQIMLTKQFGLTADEAASISKFSLLTGKASSEVNRQMVGAFAATRNSLRAGVPFKTTIADAAKVSGQLAANLQNNPARIVEAVTQAKALGTSLEQAARQGEALLNFESSLENELKAELLTGRQLNLERARAAALAGDQVALTQELVKNVGTLEDFQRMNVLQQKALAQAVGLTADELANQLKNQKIALETGKSLAQVTEEQLLEDQQRQNIQERFNNAVLKLQDIIGNLVAGPLGVFLDILSKALPYVTSIAAAFGTIYALSKGINTLTFLYKTTLAAIGLLKNKELAAQIGIATAWAVANPLAVGFGLAAAASIGSFVYSKMMDDGVVGPNGKILYTGAEGAIRLNDNDTVVAGTNLGGGGMDLTPMISAINEVRAAVNNLANRPVIVKMDSKQVGTSLVQSTYKLA